jgi:HK97 family phage major capsid protein
MKIKLNKEGLTGDNLKLVEDLEKRFAELPDSITKEVVELEVRQVAEKIKDVNFDKLKEILGDDDKGIRSILLKQGEEITRLKQQGSEAPVQSIRSQVEAWVKHNKQAIDAVKTGERAAFSALELRVPTTMTVAGSLNASPYLPRVGVLPGVVDLVRNSPTFWDRLAKGVSRLNPLVWVNKVNKEGNAQFIGEGILKPLASFELETETSVPKKVAERMKVSTEMLEDVDGLTSMITNELQYEVDMACNTAVLVGVNSSTSPAGVTTLAVPFTLATLDPVPAPNNFDAIRAAIAQLVSMNFMPTAAFVNPIDAANMDLSKATDGQYVLPPFITASGTVVRGVQVIEDNNIAVGNLLIGDFNKYKIEMYKEFYTTFGWENDDFSKNLVTIIGERRFHQRFSSNHVGAFIYDTFADIKTAITLP